MIGKLWDNVLGHFWPWSENFKFDPWGVLYGLITVVGVLYGFITVVGALYGFIAAVGAIYTIVVLSCSYNYYEGGGAHFMALIVYH